ncbi:MAG: transposase [Psychromonas sp.]|nr:transposase [Psychromonas sp.]
MDEQILTLYKKEMSTRDITAVFQEMYGADISARLVSQVTNSVTNNVVELQSRALNSTYAILYMDCVVLKNSSK